MANPALNEKVLKNAHEFVGESRMSLNGTINKTGFLLLIAAFGASLGWGLQSTEILIGSFVVALILSFLIIFKPERAAYLSQTYAFAEGLILGSISYVYSQKYPGIASNAMFLTLGCLFVMLGLYRFKIIRVTERFRSIVVSATMAIALVYVVQLVMSMFGSSGIPMIYQSSAIGIGFSLFVVGLAAFNLLLDFDLIDRMNNEGAPKYMEWYGAFALLLTLVWLYLEILRLLSKRK